jgi:Holliday junction resolvasome RuvABC ATP-dependent DNA helicase subunit
VGAIAAKLRQQEDVIKGSIEPVLLEMSFVSPTPRGRILTESGIHYLKSLIHVV